MLDSQTERVVHRTTPQLDSTEPQPRTRWRPDRRQVIGGLVLLASFWAIRKAVLGPLEEALRLAAEFHDEPDDPHKEHPLDVVVWRGAAERVLASLSTTLLVRDEHLAPARRAADSRALTAGHDAVADDRDRLGDDDGAVAG